MDIEKLKRLKPTAKNWGEVVKQVCSVLTSQPNEIDWSQLLTAVAHFPDKVRGAHLWTQKWSTAELAPLMQLMTTMRVNRTTYTAKFGTFCRSPYSKNIKKIALDYRDSDDDYVSISALLQSKHFTLLESFRLKHYVLTDQEYDLIVQCIGNFPALKRVDLLGGESGYTELAKELGQNGIVVTQARSYHEFVEQGYDFWK